MDEYREKDETFVKIAITAEATESYLPVSNITFPILQEYADRHGYTFIPKVVTESERGPVWERVRSLQSALEAHDWAVHIDADCLITNLNIPLTEIIENYKSVIVSKAETEDHRLVLNDGFLAIKDSIAGFGILAYCWKHLNAPEDKIFCLQDALQYLYDFGTDELKQSFGIVPQKSVNSFLYEEYGMPKETIGNWERGHFVLHLPGMSTEKRVELLTKYREEIVR